VSQATVKRKAVARRARSWAFGVITVAASVMMAACGSDSPGGGSTATSSAAPAESKLIIANISFPCGLNDFAKSLCQGFTDVEKELPKGYKLKVTNALDFSDKTGFNNLIQTGLQLDPAGVILFPNGPAAQVPVMKQACAKDVKIIVIDSAVTGLGRCQSGFITANNNQLGVNLGKWLTEHAPSSKEIGIVNLPPGAAASTDARVKGFTKTVEAAGYKVVATVNTDLSLDKTRTQVTNMLTAHPNLGTIFSTIDSIGDGTAQAVKGRKILQLSIDGSVGSVKRILTGGLHADATQAPYWLAQQSVKDMIQIIEGKTVPPMRYEPTTIVDETNAEEYIAAGGMR
jgi:ABC-type sugar transport system substrate-binding protein